VPPDEPPLPEDVSTGSEDGPLEPGLELTRLDLSEIVRDSVARASEASPSVIVEVNTPPSLPALGEADALSGVVRLLVDHACRQSDAGVTVKVRRGDEGITVHVIDRGPGLDRENAPDGFDLARTLVAFHGGILWAEPLPAGGTKVAFTIPEEPPTVQGPDLEAATEALRLLDQLSRPGFAVEDPVVLDEPGEWEPEGIASIDLAPITELAAAEAVDVLDPLVEVIEEDAVEVLDPPVEVLEPRTEAPVLEPSEVEVVEDLDEPEPEVVPGGDDEANSDEDGPDVPAALFDPPTMEPTEPQAEPEREAVATEVVVPVVDDEPRPEVPAPAVEVAAGVPGPEEASAELVTPFHPAEMVEPPKRFVLDPLHPATQLLRGLALDYDPDADDQPSWLMGRGDRSS
jgi:hypothetical protein